MSHFGLLTLISGALQLFVPTYGLRLLKRFGARQVGWFLVAAFAALALAHLLDLLGPRSPGPSSALPLDAVYAAASVLLLIGLGHLEGLLSERGQIDQQEKGLSADWETRLEETTAARRDMEQEIARLKEEGESLRAFEARYRLLFMENPQPMWIIDVRSLHLLAVNKCARRLYGLGPEELGPALRLVPQPSVAAFLRDAAEPCSGVEFRGRWQHCKQDGTPIEVEITAVDLKYAGGPARLMLATDVSARHRRELESAQAQRVEIIARLAGRFAHHFNNLLTIIDGQATMLLQKPGEPSAPERVKQISAAAGRAAALTRQMLAAGGQQPVQRERIQLNAAIQDLRPVLRRLLQDSITLECTGAPDLPPILADARAVEHIIVNLVLNARDAMPTGGTLRISTRTLRREEGEGGAGNGDRAGEFACLEIRDTGCGISPEVQSYLYEPFFTTRDIGRGTGLGLASVFGTVKQHEGWIEYSTQVGVGTEFRVLFPVAVASAGPPQKATAPAEHHGQRTVLMLEEDERTRWLARSALSREGYRVIEAESVTTALVQFGGQAEQINLLMMNICLPDGLSTHALANCMREAKPDLKVLYTCAKEISSEDRAFLLAEGAGIIHKPYTPEKLVCAVQVSLGEED